MLLLLHQPPAMRREGWAEAKSWQECLGTLLLRTGGAGPAGRLLRLPQPQRLGWRTLTPGLPGAWPLARRPAGLGCREWLLLLLWLRLGAPWECQPLLPLPPWQLQARQVLSPCAEGPPLLSARWLASLPGHAWAPQLAGLLQQ